MNKLCHNFLCSEINFYYLVLVFTLVLHHVESEFVTIISALAKKVWLKPLIWDNLWYTPVEWGVPQNILNVMSKTAATALSYRESPDSRLRNI
jgi:hypothetical protein